MSNELKSGLREEVRRAFNDGRALNEIIEDCRQRFPDVDVANVVSIFHAQIAEQGI